MSTTATIMSEEVRTASGLEPVNVDSQVEHPPKDQVEQRAKKELRRRRHDESTFTTPLQKTPEMKPFFQSFYKNVHTPAKKEYYRNERQKHKSVNENYRKLCGRSVSFEDFWQRYEYRCDLQRIMEEMKDGNGADGDVKYSASPTDVKEDQLFRDGETGADSTDENKDPQGTTVEETDSTANNAQDPSSITTATESAPDPSRANQAFKKRKSRLAKLVAAKKELRKAQQQQKAREQQQQEQQQKEKEEKVEEVAKPQEATASIKEEAPAEEKSTTPVYPETPEKTEAEQGGEPVVAKASVDIQDVYRDEDAEENGDGKKEKCECTACAIM